jgi:hypothetical protein
MKCRSENPSNGGRCRKPKGVTECTGLKGEIVPDFRDEASSLQSRAGRFLSSMRWVGFTRSQLACRFSQPIKFSSQQFDGSPQFLPGKIVFGSRLRFLESRQKPVDSGLQVGVIDDGAAPGDGAADLPSQSSQNIRELTKFIPHGIKPRFLAEQIEHPSKTDDDLTGAIQVLNKI